ncbi:Tn7-like element transposition protein TnsE [Acidithiobacillus thiooxidans]|uniref:Tn7-like element transposition protein TnsE n=1 Tax=Acidithiobacillus thiooxidans TaxID=930 RepID=UPI0009D9276F|nr:Tn7-like element transposition protein TnsE [Acidithiobacillus thiooxidans]
MKLKGVENNSVIREIGSLFRRHDDSGWHINVKLEPGQKKQHVGVSQIPILARRRVVNATEQPLPAGFLKRVVIENTRLWLAEPIDACPIPVVSRQGDGRQWCFNFEFGGTRYYLPQLELARALFLHHAYITRLALIPGGLSHEFDVQRIDNLSRALINILPNCTLPLYVRGDHELRRALAWILLDDDARQSFESIARYQLQNGYDTDKYRLWQFQFEPPPLAGVALTLRGHYRHELEAFFVYEIHGVSNLTCHCPASVDFVDPRFAVKRPGQGRAVLSGLQTGPELEIDDEQEPKTDKTEFRIETPAVTFEFVNPIQTTRIAKGKGQATGRGQGGTQSAFPENKRLLVSTDEASTQGILPSADYDGLRDRSDDTDFYVGKFKAFNTMILQLVSKPNCHHIHRETRKLPAIDGYSKHMLADGNPRYLTFHIIRKDDQVYALMEVDTSDNKNSLSTLLLRHQDMQFDWERTIRELEIRLIMGSLVWPSKFIKKFFGNGGRRISHPISSAENKSLLDQDAILRWAERVYEDME